MRHAARGADHLHLPAPGARPRAGQGADGLGRHGHRLRDRDERARRPAAAGADERGGRPHGHPGRCALPGDGAGRARHAAGRRRRRGARQDRRARRRGCRRQRRAHGDRARGAGDRARHQRRPPLRHRPAVRRFRQHHLLHAPGGRGLRARGRSRHRRGPGARRRRAQAPDGEPRQGDEARLRHRRHLHRPGRLLGNLQAHHPRQPDLRDARGRALLRHQHAGRGGAHLHLRAQQRHAALRAGARRQGPRGRHDRRPPPPGRPQRVPGQRSRIPPSPPPSASNTPIPSAC